MACLCPAVNTFAGAGRPAAITVGADGFHVGGTVVLPAAMSSKRQVGLVVILPGRTDTGSGITTSLALTEIHNLGDGYIRWAPTGGTDTVGPSAPTTSWAAIPACCWRDGNAHDDPAYVIAGIETLIATYPIDRSRIVVIGHSTGGFLGHKVAASRADLVTGLISINGYAPDRDGSSWAPSRPVHVTVITSLGDTLVLSAGNAGTPVSPEVPTAAYAGASLSASLWYGKNGGVGGSPTAFGVATDFDSSAGGPGAETTFERYSSPVTDGSVEIWSCNTTSHLMTVTAGTLVTFRDAIHARVQASRRLG